MSKYENMVKEIVRLKMALISNALEGGCCPYAVFPLETKTKQDACGDTPCRTCHQEWRAEKEREVWQETIEQFEDEDI